MYVIKDGSNNDVDFVRKSFRMEDAATQRGTLSFVHIGTSAPLEWGEDVYVYNGATKMWGGTVDNVSERDITNGSATQIAYTYQCTDFSQLAARQTISATYTAQTAGAIITSLAGDSFVTNLGISAGTIEDGAYIESITFNYLPLEMCLDELAELSGYSWNIDKDRNLQFTAVDSNPAPFDLTASNKPYRDLQVSRQRGAMVNEVYLRAGTQVGTDSVVEAQTGDGFKRAFTLGSDVGATPTIEIDTGGGYTSQTVGVNGIDTGKQWYYNVGNALIQHDSGETVLGATDKVRITYLPRLPVIINATDDASIAARAAVETGAGRYQRVIDATDVEDIEEAQLRAEAALAQYSQGRLSISYTTGTTGLEGGMSQLVALSAHGLNQRFMIESVSTTLLDDGTPWFSVTAAATQTLAGWSYWKMKSRQDRKFVVRDNEILNNLRTTKDDLTLADAEPTYNTYAGAYTVNGADTYINGFHVG